MELRIISPHKTKTYEITWIEANTPAGSIIIQPGHAPTVLSLSPGKECIFGLKSGKRETITIQRGVLEVMRTHVTLLLSSVK